MRPVLAQSKFRELMLVRLQFDGSKLRCSPVRGGASTPFSVGETPVGINRGRAEANSS